MDKIEEISGIKKIDETKILIDKDDNLIRIIITLKSVVILLC